MDIGDLKVFEAVARLGGMNRAAAELNTVQSNVTARIKALEAGLGCTLFARHSRGVSLTPAGRRLLPYADRAGRLLAEAGRAARDDGTPQGLLTIGSLETTAALRLTPLLARYAGSNPAVDFVLRTGTTRELIADTLEQRVDGAFVCGPAAHPELHEKVIFHEELSMLAAPSVASLDEAMAGGTVRIVVLRAGCSYRQMLETLLARRGITVQRHLEFGTLEAIFGCVSAGLGITMMPRALLGGVCAAGRVSAHALPTDDATVQTVFIRRRDRFASSALKAFLACIAGEFVPTNG
ncbi:MAG: LysR family transcriptional regulator [Alphaproteobacteria bacterium]|nr:LysR family transcriptional regulator [Alphaproteobacteria bacterium]